MSVDFDTPRTRNVQRELGRFARRVARRRPMQPLPHPFLNAWYLQFTPPSDAVAYCNIVRVEQPACTRIPVRRRGGDGDGWTNPNRC